MGGRLNSQDTTAVDGLDDFAQSFAKALFAVAPELRAHARAHDGALEIELTPGPARPDTTFWISTADREVTVGFSMFHTHFKWPPHADSWTRDPIEFVLSLMADETLVEVWTLNGAWYLSRILAADEEPDLTRMQPGHVVHLRSWSGARDRTIRER